MEWYLYLAYFFAGVLLANGVPHFIHGISGEKFQTLFASPPGVGKSSPLVNSLWGFSNFVAGGLLISLGHFEFGFTVSSLMAVLGALVPVIGLALHFGKLHAP